MCGLGMVVDWVGVISRQQEQQEGRTGGSGP